MYFEAASVHGAGCGCGSCLIGSDETRWPASLCVARASDWDRKGWAMAGLDPRGDRTDLHPSRSGCRDRARRAGGRGVGAQDGPFAFPAGAELAAIRDRRAGVALGAAGPAPGIAPAHSGLSLFAVRLHGPAMPLSADLLGLCGRGHTNAWRLGRRMDGRGANLPLPSLGRARVRPGARAGARRRALVSALDLWRVAAAEGARRRGLTRSLPQGLSDGFA